jgi:hypothetical protein
MRRRRMVGRRMRRRRRRVSLERMALIVASYASLIPGVGTKKTRCDKSQSNMGIGVEN